MRNSPRARIWMHLDGNAHVPVTKRTHCGSVRLDMAVCRLPSSVPVCNSQGETDDRQAKEKEKSRVASSFSVKIPQSVLIGQQWPTDLSTACMNDESTLVL